MLTTLGLIALGLMVFENLPVSLLPDVLNPKITVQVNAPDLSAREVEDLITKPLRNSLLQVDNIEDMDCISRDGASQISLYFEYGTNTNLSLLDVNEKTDLAASYLPQNVPKPRVVKTNATDIPIFFLHIFQYDLKSSFPNEEDQINLTSLVQNVIKRRIEQLGEVAFVDISGYIQPEIFIRPKPEIFIRLNINERELSAILRENNLDLVNAVIQDGHFQYNVGLKTKLNSLESIKKF